MTGASPLAVTPHPMHARVGGEEVEGVGGGCSGGAIASVCRSVGCGVVVSILLVPGRCVCDGERAFHDVLLS